jgi:hypothetical protein
MFQCFKNTSKQDRNDSSFFRGDCRCNLKRAIYIVTLDGQAVGSRCTKLYC